MKKAKYLLLLPFLALTSCGDNSIFGTYGFALGNSDGAHFGVFATLSDEKYTGPQPDIQSLSDKIKYNFNLVLDVPTEQLKDLNLLSYEDLQLEEEDPAKKPFGNVSGYYYVGKDTANGTQIHIGVGDIDDILDIPEISKELMEYVITSYMFEKCFTVHVPVSLEDLQLQLCWYGYYINLDKKIPTFVDLFAPGSGVQIWPGPKECGADGKQNRTARQGILPTADQIEAMNSVITNLPDTFGTKFKMRTIHVLKLALAKI